MVKIGMLLPEERMVEPARKIIEENRDKEYRFQLEEPFNEKDLKEETIVILGLIYRDYLASPEIREKLQKEDEEQLIENEKSNSLVEYKEPSLFKKIINFFKGIFKKNKI